MSKTILNIAYDGPAVKGGKMGVKELAPALLAAGELLEQANKTLNGDGAALAVNVKSDFKEGSFEIALELAQSLSDQVKLLLAIKDGAYSAKQIAEIVGLVAGGGLSFIAFLKWLRGRPIKKVTTLSSGNLKVETEGDYDTIEVSEETIKLYRQKPVRREASGMIEPLRKPGFEKFVAKEKGKTVQEVTKAEEAYFDVPTIPDEELLDVVREGAFNVVGVFFEEGLKWKLTDGETKLSALISDQRFLDDLDKGKIAFSKGDILKVKLRTRQWKTESGALRAEHEILKVIKQIKPTDQQIPLPFEGDEQ